MLFKSSVLRVCPRRVPSSRRLRWAFDNPVALDVWRERSWNADWVSRRDGCRSCSSTSNSASGTGDFKPPNIGRPPPRIATFVEPPTELLARCFERPTPILLVAGECRSAAWWDSTVSFFSRRGCTVGTMILRGRGNTSTDMLTLKALQAGVAAAVDKSGLPPPVIIAHSIAGFVCQQYLQSYPAAGVVLLDPFPPRPAEIARRHLMKAYKKEKKSEDRLELLELAQRVKSDSSRWEGMLWRYFSSVHRSDPWMRNAKAKPRAGAHQSPEASTEDGAQQSPAAQQPAATPYFPAKAFAQLCIDKPGASLRLERRAVQTLVLGSDYLASVDEGEGPANPGRQSEDVSMWRKGLAATARFHGASSWSFVDSNGHVAGRDGVKIPWQNFVWDWYDARF